MMAYVTQLAVYNPKLWSKSALPRRSYQHYCRCGKQVDARLEALGGSRLHPRADINREDWRAINAWLEGVLAALPGLGLKTRAELGGEAADWQLCDSDTRGAT